MADDAQPVNSSTLGVLSQPVYISSSAVGFAALLLLIHVGISLWLSLGLTRKIATAAARCVGQLLVLSLLLVPVFAFPSWWLVLIFCGLMIAVASAEAVSRPSHGYDGMLTQVLLAVAVSATSVLTYSLLLVLRPPNSFDPQYVLPMLALLLAALISSISPALNTLFAELTAGCERVEASLAFGASRWEASQALLHCALLAAVAPLLQQMRSLGLVTLPTLMAGFVLAGGYATQAALYVMVVAFLSAAAAGLGGLMVVLMAVHTLLDAEHRLRLDRLQSRAGRPSGIAGWGAAQLKKGWKKGRMGWRRLAARLQVVYRRQAWRRRGSAWFRRRVFQRWPSRSHPRPDADEVASMSSRLRDVIMGMSDEEGGFGETGPFSDTDDVQNDTTQPLLLDRTAPAASAMNQTQAPTLPLPTQLASPSRGTAPDSYSSFGTAGGITAGRHWLLEKLLGRQQHADAAPAVRGAEAVAPEGAFTPPQGEMTPPAGQSPERGFFSMESPEH